MKDIKKYITKHTNEEGELDYKALEEDVNQEINGIVAKNEEKAQNSILKEFGVESKEQLKEKMNELENKPKEYEERLQTYEEQLKEKENELNEVSTNAKTLEQERILLQEGVKDPEDRDYLLYNVNKMVDDETDFNSAWEKYKEEKGDKVERFIEPEKTQNVTTARKVSGGSESKQTDGVKSLIRERNKSLFND